MIIAEAEYLEHFGKKGMKWGQRKDRRATFKANKKATKAKEAEKKTAELNVLRKKLAPPKKFKTFDTSTPEGKAKAKAYRVQQIDRARERLNSGAARADFKDAKAQYKKDRVEVGRYTAKQAFKKVKQTNITDYHISQQIRDGKELTAHIIGAVGNVLIAGMR